jgi:hypothetical protein
MPSDRRGSSTAPASGTGPTASPHDLGSPGLSGVISCAHLAERLPEAAAGNLLLSAIERQHVEQCLRCQAELVQYRKLLRALRTLRTELLEPAPGLLAEVLAAVESAGERRAVSGVLRGRRVAYVGGLAAAATAAAAGGAIVLASRSRRRVRIAS